MTEEDLAKLRALASERTFADQIGFLFYWVHRRGQRTINEAMRPLGIEIRHMRILGILAHSGPQTQSQLIEMLEVDKSSMVYLVDTLEELGLAERRPAPGDRRAHSVHITAAGEAKAREAMNVIKAVNERRYGFLSEAEREQLRRTLWRVIEAESDAAGADADPHPLHQFLRMKRKQAKERERE